MIGRWAPWYDRLDHHPHPYGQSDAYRLGAEWLAPCQLVEDWGCGMGWFRQFLQPGQEYRGLDGTDSPHCDQVVDLVEYRSQVPGIFMRGVLEHNYDWPTVLANAAQSFTERLCIVIFTPTVYTTTVLAENVGGLGVPDIAFSLDDLTAPLAKFSVESISSDTAYGGETVIRAER